MIRAGSARIQSDRAWSAATAAPTRSAVSSGDFLRTAERDDAERAALDQGMTVRRGQSYTLRVTPHPVSTALSLPDASPLDGTLAIPVRRQARREYENRVNALVPDTP